MVADTTEYKYLGLLARGLDVSRSRLALARLWWSADSGLHSAQDEMVVGSMSLAGSRSTSGRGGPRRAPRHAARGTTRGNPASGVGSCCKRPSKEIAASDRGLLRGLRQFPRVPRLASVELAD